MKYMIIGGLIGFVIGIGLAAMIDTTHMSQELQLVLGTMFGFVPTMIGILIGSDIDHKRKR